MSLKTFHLIFITVAVLFCIGFGIWCERQANYHGLGAGMFASAAALVIYEIVFLRKTSTR